MTDLRPPEPLQVGDNAAASWQTFKQRIELYLIATEPTKPRSKEQKAAIFLHVAGQEAIDVFNTLNLSPEEANDYDALVKAFENYCLPKCNETYERYVFRSRRQAHGEPFEQFFRDLQLKARTCNFGDLRDSMLRDQIVYGICSTSLREKLLRKKDLTLVTAVECCKAEELAESQNRAWMEENKIEPVSRTQAKRGRQKCRYCNFSHAPRKCPAFGKTCNKCTKPNHFAACCTSKRAAVDDVVEGAESDSDFDVLEISTTESKRGPESRDWIITTNIEGTDVQLKVDTGAQANLLPRSLFKRLGTKQQPYPTRSILRHYGGGEIPHSGKVRLAVQLDKRRVLLEFFIVKKKQAILGLGASEQLGLVNRVNAVDSSEAYGSLKQAFPRLFTGIGRTRREYKMVLREDAVPVVQPTRRVPYALKKPLKKELDRMNAANIIEKVEEPSDWVSPLVIVRKKNGDLRVCMDPRAINRAVKREHFQLPCREEIEGDLAHAKYFSRLDANSGFHQIPLDKKTSEICTFSSPFGRYRYLRLPFGIASAPEVFQRTMSQIFDDLPGTRVYIDDVLVWGSTQKEHDERLFKALERAQAEGLTLNAEKCIFGRTEISFLGDKISSKGIEPDPDLIKCVLNHPPPTTKKDVQRLLGTVNYFGKYLPLLSAHTEALRSLIRKDTVFEWTHVHEREWAQLKMMLTEAPVLAIFNPELPTKLSTDASAFALGAVLFQQHGGDWRPVGYASRALTETERRYAQIEKEALGITFGCEKFNDYVIGRHIVIETDHNPLLAISKKEIGDMPPRLQRLFLRLLKYEFELQYVPGSKLVVADTLSRIPSREQPEKGTTDVEVHAVGALTAVVGPATLSRLQAATASDATAQDVISRLQSSMPIEGELKSFTQELSVVNGVLLKGTKVVVPASMRTEMLRRVHQGHLGLGKCKSRARKLMYWPGMSTDIAQFIDRCDVCKKFAYRQPDEPLCQRTVPDMPWARVGTDLFQHAGKHFLVVYDAYSNFPEVEHLKETSATTVIHKLRQIFARHGIPLEVCSDGGPQFASKEFKDFAARYDFVHTISSPRFPRSNGLAEKGVQVVKRLLGKTETKKEDFYLGLLNYRVCPLEDGRSPSELLMGRSLRTLLPNFSASSSGLVQKHVQARTSGRPLAPLQKGDVVRILRNGRWDIKAQVQDLVAPRSYTVLTEDGRIFRRNRQHLRKTPEAFYRTIHYQADDCDDAPDSSPSAVTQQRQEPPQATQDRPPAGTPGVPNIADSLRRSTRPRRPPDRLAYTHGFQQTETA